MVEHGEKLAEVNEVGVRRDGRWLVENISLSIARGEILTLIGPNGSGKTTTAKLVTGVLRPDAGSVWRKPGLRVGYVPQKLAIDWTLPLTVKRLMSLTASHARGEVDAALERVGIAHLAQAEVQNLSGGEFQRALLARAMLRKPDLLVLDEPVQGVDFSGEVALYDLIGQIRDETGCGILMISHDLHVVMAATDTVICLNGHVCCRGAPEQVARSPEYLSLFGARAASALALSGYVGGFCGGGPSVRALFPELPERGATCDTAGVMGPVVGMIGALQAQMGLSVLLDLIPSPLGQLVSFDVKCWRFSGFRFDAAHEPDRILPFISTAQVMPNDLLIDLRTEEAHPFRADALHLDAAQAQALIPPTTARRVVFACRTGLRAHHAGIALQNRWNGKIALLAVPPTDT